MLPLIVLAGAVAVAWRLGFWPFDSSYKLLPKYSEYSRSKTAPTATTKPAP